MFPIRAADISRNSQKMQSFPRVKTDPLLYYQYPTWSRDGSQLAFIGLKSDGSQTQSTVMIANMDDDSVNEIYKSESEHPIYLNWSPDNANLSFISTQCFRTEYDPAKYSCQGWRSNHSRYRFAILLVVGAGRARDDRPCGRYGCLGT